MARRKLRPAIDSRAILGLLGVVVLLWGGGAMLDRQPRGTGMEAGITVLGMLAAAALGWMIARRRQPTNSPVAPTIPAPRPESQSPADRAPAAQPAAAPASPLAPALELPRLPPQALMADTSGTGRLPLHTVYAGMPSAAFAALCARQLQRAGWDASVTAPQQGTQADVVAERDGCRVTLQCAIELNAIGYRAVEQAVAARADENAAVGVVVSNNGYTAAAQHLAAQNRILLLAYRDLPALDRLLANADQPLTVEAV